MHDDYISLAPPKKSVPLMLSLEQNRSKTKETNKVDIDTSSNELWGRYKQVHRG